MLLASLGCFVVEELEDDSMRAMSKRCANQERTGLPAGTSLMVKSKKTRGLTIIHEDQSLTHLPNPRHIVTYHYASHTLSRDLAFSFFLFFSFFFFFLNQHLYTATCILI
jgi:hypothetical protein